MNEKHMQTFFGKYLKAYPSKKTEVYELKYTKGQSLPFSAIQDHQVEALLDVQQNGLYHKITDQPWGFSSNVRYTSKKPFDCVCFNDCQAFVVVWFYQPRKEKIFYKIPINIFLSMNLLMKRKSFREEHLIGKVPAINITRALKLAKG